MRIILGDHRVVEVVDVYIKKEFSNPSDPVPDSVAVYMTCYDRFMSKFTDLKVGYFKVSGDKSIFDKAMKTYEERILLRLLADGFCWFNYLGKYWKSCIE